jgi:hypothetical protein
MALIPLAVAGCGLLGRRTVYGLVAWQGAILAILLVAVEGAGFLREQGDAAVSAAGVRAPGARPNPVADLYGWKSAALRGAALVAQRHARGLAVMNWSLASRLAWYARPMPVFVVPPHVDQFAMWFGSLQPGDSAIVVDWSGMPLQPPVGAEGFVRCTPIEQQATVVDGRQIAHFSYLYCDGWKRHAASGSKRDAPTSAPRAAGEQ